MSRTLLGHRANRVATVGPVGVHVQVAAQRGADRVARIAAGLGDVLLELREVRRCLARECLGDDGRGRVADVREVAQAAALREPCGAPRSARRAPRRAARRNACTR